MKTKLIFIGLMSAMLLSACGSKKEEAKDDSAYDGYEGSTEAASGETDLVALGKVLVDESDCKTCHHPTNKIVGPAHADVAAKYDFTEANVKMLAGKIINGGSGVWGEIPMNAHADVSQADAENMARYVLSLDGETEH
jgi:cytochrome c